MVKMNKNFDKKKQSLTFLFKLIHTFIVYIILYFEFFIQNTLLTRNSGRTQNKMTSDLLNMNSLFYNTRDYS